MGERGDDLGLYIGEIGWSTIAAGSVTAVPDATRADYVAEVLGAASVVPPGMTAPTTSKS